MTIPMGAHLTSDHCSFRVWAPHAARVTVMGSFNEWRDDEFPLVRTDDDTWVALVPGVHAGDEYLFVIDNLGGDEFNPGTAGLRRTDPYARNTRHSSGNAVIVDVPAEIEASGLASDGFTTPISSDWMIYQAHIGSFTGLNDDIETGDSRIGTYAQFETKLSYIRSLGFNAIALLPIHENPGDGNEGYAPTHLFAPESSFGSPFELRHLIRAAHDAGLAVIFDVVWNHFSDIDNRLWEFDGMTREGGIYFEGAGRSPWGPRPAFWKREVRDLIVAHARMCFEEYHVDGLRIDAGDEIGHETLVEVVASVRTEPLWQAKLLIVEWSGHQRGIWPELTEVLHFDRVWALGDPQRFADAVNVGGERDPAGRVDALLGMIGLPYAVQRIRYLLGSHDSAHDNTGGSRSDYRYFVELAGGRDDWAARAKARMGWALGVVLPGTPMCFMGAECHQPGYWHPRADGNPFHDDHRFDWSIAGDQVGMEMRRLVRDANQLWWDSLVLRVGGLEVIHVDRDNGVVAFLRTVDQAPSQLVVVNASEISWPDEAYRIPLPEGYPGAWRITLDSQAASYGGEGFSHPEIITLVEGALQLSLPQWSLMLLESLSPL
ncbi:MAG: alpha-amylase family glycosyl hydrolase [Gemmatimonadota bacterium]